MRQTRRVQEPARSSVEHSLRQSAATVAVVVLGIMAVVLGLGGCNRISDADIVTASGIVLQDQLDRDYQEAFDTWWGGAPWASESAAETRVDSDAAPAWATGTYDMCIYWERSYSRSSTVRQQGPDLIKLHSGIGWGWILMNRDLEFHILETGFRWIDYEDDVAVQSGSVVVIDAWDEPPSED